MPVRDDRLTWPWSGVGGYLEFYWPYGKFDPKPTPTGSSRPTATSAGAIKPNHEYMERLEVQKWTVQPIYRNLEIGGSGGFGSLRRRRVVADFKWTANIDLDLTPVKDGSVRHNSNRQPYLEGRLEGNKVDHFQIAMKFQVGDPSLEVPATVAGVGISGMFYFCPRVMLDDVHVSNSIRPPTVIRCIVRGSGSAPLQRWVDGTQTGGAGGFAFAHGDLLTGQDDVTREKKNA